MSAPIEECFDLLVRAEDEILEATRRLSSGISAAAQCTEPLYRAVAALQTVSEARAGGDALNAEEAAMAHRVRSRFLLLETALDGLRRMAQLQIAHFGSGQIEYSTTLVPRVHGHVDATGAVR